MIYTDDEILMLRALHLLEDNQERVKRIESEAYMVCYYDNAIDLLKKRLYKEDK